MSLSLYFFPPFFPSPESAGAIGVGRSEGARGRGALAGLRRPGGGACNYMAYLSDFPSDWASKWAVESHGLGPLKKDFSFVGPHPSPNKSSPCFS